MKKLQKMYTTPGQSRWLLKFGVPRWSADIIYLSTPDSPYDPYIVDSDNIKLLMNGKGLPCWTVGRLMEIFNECSKYKLEWPDVKDMKEHGWKSYAKLMIESYKISRGYLDFSKLD